MNPELTQALFRAYRQRIAQLESQEYVGASGIAWDEYDIRQFDAIGDGLSHPLSEGYSTLSQAQQRFPFAWSLNNELDGCALQLAEYTAGEAGGGLVTVPEGTYLCDALNTDDGINYIHGPRISHSNVTVRGKSAASCLKHADGANLATVLHVQAPMPRTTQIHDVVIENLAVDGNKAALGAWHTQPTKLIRLSLSNVDEPANWTVRGCWCHDAYQPGAEESGGIAVRVSDLTYGNGTIIQDYYKSGVALLENICWGNMGWGVGLNSVNWAMVVGNRTYENGTMGITLWDCQDGLATENLSWENEHNQLNLEICDRIHTVNNLLSKMGTGWLCYRAYNSRECEFLDNTLVYYGVGATTAPVYIDGSGTGTGHTNYKARPTVDLTIAHNRILRTGANGYVVRTPDPTAHPEYAGYEAEDVTVEDNLILNNEPPASNDLGIFIQGKRVRLRGNRIRGTVHIEGMGDTIEYDGNKHAADYAVGTGIGKDAAEFSDFTTLMLGENRFAIASNVHALYRVHGTADKVLISDHLSWGDCSSAIRVDTACDVSVQGGFAHIGTFSSGPISGTVGIAPPADADWGEGTEIWRGAGAVAGDPGGWVRIGGVWRPAFGQRGYRSGAASPVGVLTPIYIGEMYLETSTPRWYRANGVLDTNWECLSGVGDADTVDGLHALESGASAHVLATDAAGGGTFTGNIYLPTAQFRVARTSGSMGYGHIQAFITKALTDNPVTPEALFTITTATEASGSRGGNWACWVKGHVVCGRYDSSYVSCQPVAIQFHRAMEKLGTGVLSAVTEPTAYASADTNAGQRTISTITWALTETSEYISQLAVTVDMGGSTAGTPNIWLEVVLLWWGFLTAPVVAGS